MNTQASKDSFLDGPGMDGFISLGASLLTYLGIHQSPCLASGPSRIAMAQRGAFRLSFSGGLGSEGSSQEFLAGHVVDTGTLEMALVDSPSIYGGGGPPASATFA
jgi:hypothetical protein